MQVDFNDTIVSRLINICMHLPSLGCIRVEDRSPVWEPSLFHPGLGYDQLEKRGRLHLSWNGPYDIVHPEIQSTHRFHVDSRKFAYETVFELVRELDDAGKPTMIDVVM